MSMLVGEWQAASEAEWQRGTTVVYEGYGAMWVERFKTLDAITAGSVATYRRERMRGVRRSSMVKELAALRTFLRWCADEGHPALDAKLVESPHKTAKGFIGARELKQDHLSAEHVVLTREQAEAIIAHLPERIRARATFQYETALRPSTVAKLRVTDFDEATGKLRIRREADKAADARMLPLSKKALAALLEVLPEVGLIFGPYGKLQKHLRRAAKAAGMPAQVCRWISPYDLRHSRLTSLGATGNLPGVMFLAGHQHVTTSAKYIHASEAAALSVLEADAKRKPPKRKSSGPERAQRTRGTLGKRG